MARVGLILTPGLRTENMLSPFYGIDVRFFAPAMGQFRSQGGLAVLLQAPPRQLHLRSV